MTREEKAVVINSLVEQLNAYPHFYITNIEALNAEQTASLRRKCFESNIKLVVVKNTLLSKALENVDKADADLVKVLEGSTSVMFTETRQSSGSSDQGVPQDERQARSEGCLCRGLRLCRRQPTRHSVQHQEQRRTYRRYRFAAAVACEERYFRIAG